MLSTSATSMGWTTVAGIRCCCKTVPNNSRANSPPCPNAMPVRQASRADRRVARKASVLSRILTGTSTTSHASTASGAERICAASSCRPMVTKNTPDNTSRNGLRWLSMWCRKSLSPSTIPARKAPRAADTPTACAAAAAATTTHKETSTNDSSWPRRATQPSRPCNRRRETRAAAANSSSTPNTSSSTCSIFGDSPRAQIASKASRGTLARS
ncbi:Uncharacterised protein [Klebsiella pneumoniae]|nr:Uncharacterised protein [Klebsiella pneumoniae]